MRDSFIDDKLLDRTMREKFPLMVDACRSMSAAAVDRYIIEMPPAIVREYRLKLVRDGRWLARKYPHWTAASA